jgi:transposase InsO family protein
MKKWFSALELAGGFLGLPPSRRAIADKAKREKWESRPRQGRGGGLEYHISSLPVETQRALALKQTNEEMKKNSAEPAFKEGKAEATKLQIKEEVKKSVTQQKRLESLAKSEALKGLTRDRMNAKLEIIKHWETFRENSTDSVTAAQFFFCAAYNKGEIEVPEWVRGVISSTSQPSLMKWIKKQRQEGITALAGKYGTRRGSGIFAKNRELYNLAVAMMDRFPHCEAKEVFQAIVARQEKLGLEKVPSIKTVTRFMETWKRENKQVFAHIQSPDAWRSKYGAAFGDMAAAITRYLQCWEMDSTPTDVMLKDGRHTLIGVIDIKSRRAKLLVNKTSKAVAVAALIRRSILDWGVPECIKTDNGSDYTSKYLIEAIQALEIEHLVCAPFSPDRKPFIESFFGTFNHGLLTIHDEYIGNSVAERKKIEDRKSFSQRYGDKADPIELGFMDSAQLQEFCDKWTETLYYHEPHSGLGGKTPADMVNAWINDGNQIRRISNERVLDYLLAEAPGGGTRVVGKKGIIIDHFSFIAPELGAYIGETVVVKYDPFDAGKIMVFDGNRDYICTAVRPELMGLDRSEVAAVSRQTQKKFIAEKKKEVRKISSTAGLKNITDEILQKYAENAPAKPEGKENSVEYNTRALQAAADAMIVSQTMGEEPETFEELNASAQTVTEEAKEKFAKIIDLESKRVSQPEKDEQEKAARYQRYEALAARGFQDLSEEEREWLESWRETPEGRVYIRFRDASSFEVNTN